jgi:hypothetical protein
MSLLTPAFTQQKLCVDLYALHRHHSCTVSPLMIAAAAEV